MERPLVSVIIPNYNYARYLPQAIDSVLAQTYPRVEIVVVDDGSRDDSAAVLERYGSQINAIRQQNQGVAAARNRGAQASSGEYLAFLDADDYWLPAKLERQMARFQQEPELGMVYCSVEEFNEQGTVRFLRDGAEGWVAKDLLLGQRMAFFGGGSGFVTPRAVFDEVGGFDERLSTSADWELIYRLAARRKTGFVPDVLLKYRIHSSNMHANVGVMEREMMLSYGKAFAQATPEVQQLRRRCYGRLHMILAGSYFRAGQSAAFLRHALKSLWLTPSNATRLLAYPVRLWRRLNLFEKVQASARPLAERGRQK